MRLHISDLINYIKESKEMEFVELYISSKDLDKDDKMKLSLEFTHNNVAYNINGIIANSDFECNINDVMNSIHILINTNNDLSYLLNFAKYVEVCE